MNLFRELLFAVAILTTPPQGVSFPSQTVLVPGPGPSEPAERIVTNLRLIYGSQGVSLSTHYNETVPSPSDQLASVPGCPKSIDGYPWVYYGNPPRCYLAGQAGPCPGGQRLYIKLGSPQGMCSCECLAEWSRQFKGYPNKRFLSCPDNPEDAPYGQIVDTKLKKCYNLFDQGSCPKGEVVVNHVGTSLICGPLCNTAVENWEDARKRRPCVTAEETVHPRENLSENRDCPPEEIFSETLRVCLRRFPNYLFIKYPERNPSWWLRPAQLHQFYVNYIIPG